MELKEFVKRALLDVAEGVAAAQGDMPNGNLVGSTGQMTLRESSKPDGIVQDYDGHLYSIVSFDVAVTTVDEVRGEGGIKVFSIGASGGVTGKAETASRIQFATTVRLA
jgi:hypothetical protein